MLQSNIIILSGIFFFPLCLPSIKNCHNRFFSLFVKLDSWPARQTPQPQTDHDNFILWWKYLFHFIHDCDSFTKTVIAFLFCNMFCKLFYFIKMLEQTVCEQNINVHKLQSSLFFSWWCFYSGNLAVKFPNPFKTRWKWSIWVWNNNSHTYIKV